MGAGEHDDLRQEMRVRRQALDSRASERAGTHAAARVADLVELACDVRTVAAYWPVAGELDPRPAAEHFRARGASVLLPVLDGQRLRFAPWEPTTTLADNRFGIPEPVVAAEQELIDGPTIDLVLVPVVAVDRTGTRVGMGAGYYDRTFAGHPFGGPPLLVGLAHSFQVVDRLDAQPWDVPLDVVVTPEEIFRPR